MSGRAFAIEPLGGDHQTMPWRDLQVVDPPRIASSEGQLSPPEYTSWNPQAIQGMPTALRVLEGTRVSVHGTADRPIVSAEIDFVAEEKSRVFTSEFKGGQIGFEIPSGIQPWTIHKSGEYQLKLTGVDGTTTVGADSWAVRVVPDQPPTVAWLDSLNDDCVTSQAIVQLALQSGRRPQDEAYHFAVSTIRCIRHGRN